MKTTNLFVLATLALAGLSACKNDKPVYSNFPEDGVVRFNVEMNKTQSRASHDDAAASINEFGIFINNPNNQTYTYNNKKVTATAGDNGKVWNVEGGAMLWRNATDPVDIVAYAPYNTTEGYTTASKDFPVVVSTAQSKSTYESDFIICRLPKFVPSTGLNNKGQVDLTFTHALSQLTVNLVLGTEFNSGGVVETNPISGPVKIQGVALTGACDFTKENGFVTPTVGTTGSSITPYESEFKAAAQKTDNAKVTYQCILIPQTVGAGTFSISFKINGKDYAWSSAQPITFVENTHYTMTLNVGKDEMTLTNGENGSVSSSNWTDNGSTNVGTD